MIDDYTRGGQIFLHRLRMFRQVAAATTFWSFVVSIVLVFYLSFPKYQECNWAASRTYVRALFIDTVWQIMPKLSEDSKRREPKLDVFDKQGKYRYPVKVSSVLLSPEFKSALAQSKAFVVNSIKYAIAVATGLILAIFLVWSRFGKNARATKHLSGSSIKTASEVRKYLESHNLASRFKIADMPLVKDTETRHFLVTGATGSGKTNLFNTLLPQVRSAKQPALVIDQTGEMIARYYDPSRGDIIFNPLDSRSHAWDFWADATANAATSGNDMPNGTVSDSGANINIGTINIDTRLEKFAKVLFSFGKKANNGHDPFWQNSAETIFVACVELLVKTNNKSIKELKRILQNSSVKDLEKKLQNTKASRYLNENNKVTGSSILSVMTTSTKPLNFLFEKEQKFSLKEYFKEVNSGSDAWLFLSTSPSAREVTLPLIACLLELAVYYLIEIGINEKRRMWFVIDELAALGRLNAFTTLLSESRKYGGCVLAATQSINQLFENYGHYSGSAIFDQFATKFIFRSSEPSTARIISDVFGHIEYASQQKNTSYGAHEHRDGVSYTEQEKRKQLITTHDIASLGSLECFVGLPEPNIRIARVKLPAVTNVPQQHQGFMPYAASYSLPYSPQYSTYSIWDSIPSQQELENMKKQQTKAIGEQSQQGQGQEGLRPQVRVNKEESMEEDVTKEQQIS